MKHPRAYGLAASCAAALVLAGAAMSTAGPGAAEDPARKPESQEEGSPHGKFVEDCAQCHGPEGWKPAVISKDFDHGKRGFVLLGAHRRVACLSCHTKLDFTSASSDCVACHADVHQGELGQDCARCHTTNTFIERADEVRSHRQSRFPLTGAHLSLDCRECHTYASPGQLVFVNTPANCDACHLDDYNTVKSPDHVAGSFPLDCSQCHSTATWSGSAFNHAVTGFPLGGGHRSLACEECHIGGTFGGAPAECVACHQDDYDQTTNPAHAAAGFPTTCEDCHSSSGWTGASFNHGQWFPINSGAHAGEWSACTDCHINPSNYTDFTCLSCHPHSDKAKTDGDHRGENGYVYDSRECYRCHPNGRGD